MAICKVKLNICGSDYIISCTDSEEYVFGLGERLNEEMSDFLKSNQSSSITTAAILTALGYLDELQKTNSGADNMRSQIRDYLEDASRAKLEAEELKHQLADSNRRLDHAYSEIERLKKEIGYTRGQD